MACAIVTFGYLITKMVDDDLVNTRSTGINGKPVMVERERERGVIIINGQNYASSL